HRIRGLDVVMPIDEDGRRAGRIEPLAEDDRMAGGRQDLGAKPRACEEAAHRLRAASDILRAGGVGADARNPQEILELSERAFAVPFDPLFDALLHASSAGGERRSVRPLAWGSRRARGVHDHLPDRSESEHAEAGLEELLAGAKDLPRRSPVYLASVVCASRR